MSLEVRGRRDGTGPYKGSMRRGGMGRRRLMGMPCPNMIDDKVEPQPKIKIN